MQKSKREQDFLNLPTYPGGNEAFRKFIAGNLKYPKEALEKGIEGIVDLEYEVDDNGNVHNPKVLNGIGCGCDEEALRLAKLLKYKKVKNRGIRVRSTVKSKIAFKLPGVSMNYTYKSSDKKKPENKSGKPESGSYNYTISI